MDERLAHAFRSLADGAEVGLPDEVREQIWHAVSGSLPAEERRVLVDRMASDPAYAEAWRIAHEMWTAAQGATPAAPPVRPVRRWAPAWLAAAAVLLVGTTVGLVTLRDTRSADEFRSASGYLVESRVAEEVLPRRAFRLRWAPGPEGARYRVTVTTEELVVIATAADLTEPQFAVPESSLSEIPTGARVLWQVEANLPDGTRVASRTFVTRIE